TESGVVTLTLDNHNFRYRLDHVPGQGAAIHVVMVHMQMAQRGRGNVDQRTRLPPHPGLEAAALADQERPLLVRAEPAMLAKADLALAVRWVLHDRGVAGDAVRVDPVLAGQRDRDLHRR